MRRLLLLTAVMALLAAACGGSADASGGVASLGDATATESGSDAPADQAASVDVEEAALAFTQCLRDNGLDVADPEFDGAGGFRFDLGQLFRGGEPGAGGPSDEVRTAMDACRDLLAGVGQRFSADDQAAREDQLLAFAACMRDNGVDMPDPDFSATGGGPGGGPGAGIFRELDLSDPDIQAAFEACQSDFAFGGPGGGPGAGGFGRGGNA